MVVNFKRLILIINRIVGKRYKLENCGEEFLINRCDLSRIN